MKNIVEMASSKTSTQFHLDHHHPAWIVSCSILIINFSVSSLVSSSWGRRAVSSFCITVTWDDAGCAVQDGEGEDGEGGDGDGGGDGELCLRGGELELSKTHLVTGFQVEDVVALPLQQRLEGQDELEVGGGSHIVAPCKSCKIKFSLGRKIWIILTRRRTSLFPSRTSHSSFWRSHGSAERRGRHQQSFWVSQSVSSNFDWHSHCYWKCGYITTVIIVFSHLCIYWHNTVNKPTPSLTSCHHLIMSSCFHI